MTKAPTLVLDLDGTLADTAPDLLATLNHVLGGIGLPPVALPELRSMMGAGAKALLERGLKAAGRDVSDGELESLFDVFIAHYETHICDHSALYPGALDALDRFSTEGWQLAVCTNKLLELTRPLLDALGVADRFAAVCGGDSFTWKKPDPRHITLTVEQAGGDPRRSIMVGDSRPDVMAARAARIPVIGVTFGYTDTPMAELGPDAMIDHFDDLHAAATRLLADAAVAG